MIELQDVPNQNQRRRAGRVPIRAPLLLRSCFGVCLSLAHGCSGHSTDGLQGYTREACHGAIEVMLVSNAFLDEFTLFSEPILISPFTRTYVLDEVDLQVLRRTLHAYRNEVSVVPTELSSTASGFVRCKMAASIGCDAMDVRVRVHESRSVYELDIGVDGTVRTLFVPMGRMACFVGFPGNRSVVSLIRPSELWKSRVR